MVNPEEFWLVKRLETIRPELLDCKIEKWDEGYFSTLKPFVRELYWNGQASVNVFRVIGTQHPDYHGLTWIDFLKRGKRMHLNLGLFDSNPDYYLSCGNKQPTMFYQGIDGGYLYIGGDGNHRTAIARAYFFIEGRNVLHGVDLRDYRIDWEMRHLYGVISEIIAERRLPIKVEPHQEVVKRTDSGNWMEEKYRVRLKLTDFRTQSESLLDRQQAERFLEKLKSQRYRRFFSILNLLRGNTLTESLR